MKILLAIDDSEFSRAATLFLSQEFHPACLCCANCVDEILKESSIYENDYTPFSHVMKVAVSH